MTPEIEEYAVEGFRGELAAAHRPADLAAEIRRLTDPASARDTLHWGRNYLYAGELDGRSGRIEVVVKQFRNQGLAARLRRRWRGSKALRSWRAALALEAAGVPTAEPVMLVESVRADGPSFLVTRRLRDVFEARYLFRAVESGRLAELFPRVDLEAFYRELGRTLRRLHEAGIWHRDVSVGNLLAEYGEAEGAAPTLYLIDLNRARIGCRMTVSRRTRDLCRLRIFDPRQQEALLRAYWGAQSPGFAAKRLLYRLYSRSFLIRHGVKNALRRPLRRLTGALAPRRAHVHIPPAPAGASSRDRVVWDRLSDQPHQHAGRLRRLAVRLADSVDHARSAAAALGAAPRVWRRYRELRRDLYRQPCRWSGGGVAVRPWPGRQDELLAALEELATRRALIRLHPWERDHSAEEELARELHGRGYELLFVLPQNRELVREPRRWRLAVEDLARRFRPYGRHFQVGQAVNRSKWGIWKYQEYLAMAAEAAAILRRQENVEVLGPGVIDFEVYATMAILNLPASGLRFDAVASLLYVDRRGAPENRQAGFDTVAKVVLLRAIAESSRNSAGRSWITEVNWPLWEGPHAPAGRSVAVDEETQADYLARYCLLALGTGLVERVYWWQLVARGYGLIDPGAGEVPRRRPAFHALATLNRRLEGATCLGPQAAPEPARLYRFQTAAGHDLVIAWSAGEPCRANLPRPAAEVWGRGGERQEPPAGVEVELGPSPRYFRLA